MTTHLRSDVAGSAARSFLRRATRLAAIASAALAAPMATTSAAHAATIPYHNYSYSCTGLFYLPGDSHPKWQHTAAKRVLDGWPVGYAMEAWDRQVGAWMDATLGDFYDPTSYDPNNPSNTSDMFVRGYELGMYVRADLGVRTWTFTTETYWAPPYSGPAPSPYDPTIPSGGPNWYDTASSGGWPSVMCSA
jgi:hypothetical protein